MKKSLLSIISLIIAAVIIFPSCLKENQAITNNPSTSSNSWWMVDTERFESAGDYVTGAQSYVILSGAASTGNNKFNITFNLPYVPAQGSYLLDCSNTNSTAACMELTYNGIPYKANPAQSVYIQADSANQRAKLNVNTTWFYNTLDPNDSITVIGVFYQPQ